MIRSEPVAYLTVIFLLAVASVVGRRLRKYPLYHSNPELVEEIIVRINSWWMMLSVLLFALALWMYGLIALFILISLLALREYFAVSAEQVGEQRRLLWISAVVTLIQYWLILIHSYGLYSVLIPLIAGVWGPLLVIFRGSCSGFLQRAAQLQWGLIFFVYFLSFAPALLTLHVSSYEEHPTFLLFYLIFITEMNDILQFISGKAFGRRKIAPAVSPNKTWEGLLGGLFGSALIGAALFPLTPFSALQSAGAALIIGVAGFFGGLTMSAIKRDRGVKDFGTLIAGHGGMIDRIDSLCFSAPVFFYLVRFYFTA